MLILGRALQKTTPRTSLLLVLVLALFLLSLASPAGAATFTVTKTTDSSDGSCTVADCSLREAVQASIVSPGSDIVSLGAGTYVLSIPGREENTSLMGDIDIFGGDTVTIRGAGATATVIDGGGIDRVFHIINGIVTLEDLTVTGGNVNPTGLQQGGGILNQDALTLRAVVLRNNSAIGPTGDGGGVWSDGSLTVTGSTIRNNTAGGNEADGGGIWADGSTTITNSTVRDNQVAGTLGDGAGIFNLGTMTLQRSTVNGNQASGTSSDGAGIFNDGILNATNSTISGNLGSGNFSEGGGLFNSGTATLLNVTFANNLATDGGSAIANAGTANVTNSIINGSCSEFSLNSGGGNVESPGNTCGLGSGDQIAIAASSLVLGPLAANGGPTRTHAIFSGSAALDRGLNGPCPGVDQRNLPRPKDGDANGSAVCDAGAFEADPGPPPACLSDGSTLCLNGDRFRLKVDWLTPTGQRGEGQAVELTDDTGYFWFFNAANVELVIKVLNGCPSTQHYWVFAAGLTNVQLNLRVTDTATGDEKVYSNSLGQEFQPIQDTRAFQTCAFGVTGEQVPQEVAAQVDTANQLAEVTSLMDRITRLTAGASLETDLEAGGLETATQIGVGGGCVSTDEVLCLNQDRFRVLVDWRTRQGDEGAGKSVRLTNDTGYFWFFNAANVEVVIKILNACVTRDRYWVFMAGLTNVEVNVLVQDVLTGQIKEYTNRLGTPFPPILDTQGLSVCP